MYEQLIRRAEQLRRDNPRWRRGAAAFLALAEYDTALSNEIIEHPDQSIIDPYYDDDNILRFWMYVYKGLAERETA